MTRPTRRTVLTGALAGAILAWARPAFATEAEWQISYCDCADLEDALDVLSEVEEVLGAAVATRMGVVVDADRMFHVVLPVEGSDAKARALMEQHDALLREAWDVDAAQVRLLEVRPSEAVYNVSYGLGPNYDELVRNWDTVARMLGPGVARDLVIEQTPKGNFALVYRRYGDLESTRKAAARHDSLLRSEKLDAAVIKHQNNAVVWTGTSAVAPHTPSEPPIEPRLGPAPEDPPRPEDPSEDPPEDVPVTALGFTTVEMSAPDTALAASIEAHVKAERAAGRVAGDEQTSWLVFDLTTDTPLASINLELPRQCASMIKPLVALAFFHAVDEGRLTYDDAAVAKFEAMIQKSSNSATDWAIKQVGGPSAVHALLHEHYGTLLPQVSVVEYIGSAGRTYKNLASAGDLGRFLRSMWRDELPHSAELKRLMNLPGRDRLYNGAPAIPVGTGVYNKTGSTSRLCGDMGILDAQTTDGGRWPYIVVGVVDKEVRTSNYGAWIRNRGKVIRAVSDLVYAELKVDNKLV
jgi:beta-lactamase class A